MSNNCNAETLIPHRDAARQYICDHPNGHDGPHEWEEEAWTRGRWVEEVGPLPTAEGMATGVVASWDATEATRARIKVQCSTCHRTRIDDVFWAVKSCTFAADPGATGWHKYRRCDDCRNARRHPKAN